MRCPHSTIIGIEVWIWAWPVWEKSLSKNQSFIVTDRNELTTLIWTWTLPLPGRVESVQSCAVTEEASRKAYQLWHWLEALKYSMKSLSSETPHIPLGNTTESTVLIMNFPGFNCSHCPRQLDTVYSTQDLKGCFYAVQKWACRIAMTEETWNSVYQDFLFYLQSLLQLPPKQWKPLQGSTPKI